VQRILSRLSYANVIATIALFAALGGGYAVAFSGSGTLQKAYFDDFTNPTTPFTTVRTLTGIGSLQANCANPGTNPDIDLRIHNTSDRAYGFRISSDDDDSVTGPSGVEGDSDSAPFELAPSSDYLHLYVYALRNKRPQIDIQVNMEEGDLSCASGSSVSVLALNTEE